MKKIWITAIAVVLCVTITGLSHAAQKVITQYSNTATGISGTSPPIVSPIPDMGEPIVTKAGAVTKTSTTINLGGSIYDGAGAVWYQGESDLAYCTMGACTFGQGLRAFFNFQFTTQDNSADSTNSADGFVFAIVNASLNVDGSGIPNRTGGAPSQTSMGELMGYAGPGTTADKLGIRPPKMGIEFDTYPNKDGDICKSGSRKDEPHNNDFRNHVALMFWGDNLSGDCTYSGTAYPKSSFDDNHHTSGDEPHLIPVNSSNPDPSHGTADPASGYYADPGKPGGYNWFEDGQLHGFRIEIDRSTKADGSGNGLYTTRAWVDCNGTSCASPGETAHFQDVVNPFTDQPPQINRMNVELSPADHQLMNRILFGFTEATGGATQIATITNFVISFPKTPPAPPCSNTLSASDNSAAPLGATTGLAGTVTITASPLCAWTATNNGNTWITVSPTSGAGGASQTVTYTASPNTGIARNATITIGGQNFQVYQAGGCNPSISPTGDSFSSSAGTGTVNVTVGTGCTWTASVTSGGSWLSITSGGSGTGDGSVGYSAAANTGAARTGTLAIAGQTFTVNQQAACTLTIADNSFACKSGTSSSRVYIKVYLTDGTGGAVTDATVTYSVPGGGGSGTLTNNGNGWYGGTRTSNCGLGGGSERTGNLSGSRTVTVTATRAGCVGSPLTKTMTVP